MFYCNPKMINFLSLLLFLAVLLEVAVGTESNNLLAGRKYCGYQHTDDYPRLNNSIAISEFPWTVQLLYDNNKLIQCTGSLINRRYILTAAHCVENPFEKLIGVRLGDYLVNSDKDCINDKRFGEECSDPTQDFAIEEKHQHPAFDQLSSAHDIGLLRINKDVVYSEYIRPICLPNSSNLNLKIGKQLSTTGWGLIGDKLNKTDIKKKVITKLEPISKCTLNFFQKDISEYHHLCAKEKDAHTCQGDSGAPLMNSIRNQWEQVGILIQKQRCGSSAIYLKVTSYLEWILATLRP